MYVVAPTEQHPLNPQIIILYLICLNNESVFFQQRAMTSYILNCEIAISVIIVTTTVLKCRSNGFLVKMALLRTNWPDSMFHFSLIRSLVLTALLLCCSLFSYQSGEEDWEPASHMLSLAHCRQMLANEKQESIATVSTEKKNISFHS